MAMVFLAGLTTSSSEIEGKYLQIYCQMDQPRGGRDDHACSELGGALTCPIAMLLLMLYEPHRAVQL